MLAEVYVRKGDYAAAEPLLKRSFEMFRSPMTRVELTQPGGGALFGHDVRRLHYKPNYAYALESAARLNFVYLKENKPAEAAAILKQALELVDKNTSTSDTVFPETIYGFGLSCVINDNLEGAESVFDRLITLTGKAKGPAKNAAFESALRLQTSLADTLIKKQKLADAELLYTSLSSAADKNFGPDSRESDEALVTLTQYYLNHDQAAKAEPLFQRQLAHAEKFQPDGPALAPILAGLETVYSTLGRDPELDAVYQKQIVVYEKVFGQNSVGLVKPLNARAALLHKLKRDAEAEPLEARANAITAAQTK
jgi:tetratricopeptide (TPR) repeat protein